ncbi:MAG: integrase family protein [Desulfobacteraceae bacterium]|nr:integrase family protein [Desulfobacteraceae bacterium]
MPKLTKTFVDALTLPKDGQKLVWDDDLKGFGIRLTPTAKTYIAQGRVNGKTRRVTIGKHGTWAPHKARESAQGHLYSMSQGVDPTKEKKRRKALSATLNQISEAYINDRRHLKQSSIRDIRKHINGSFSDWAEKPAANITRDKVLTRFRELSKRSPAQANQAFRILRALLNYAAAAYRAEDEKVFLENPVSVLSDSKVWNPVQARASKIPTDRIGHTWGEIQKIRATPQTKASQAAVDIVAFLLLTGARWTEASTLTWDQVDLESGCWHLPDPKNRRPVIFPLSSQARQILEGRPRLNKFVFYSYSKTGHVTDARQVISRLTDAATVKVRPHDLRRTFRAVAGECGIELWKTKLLMNHKLSGDITISAYTETSDLRYLAPEIQQIADWIEAQANECEN